MFWSVLGKQPLPSQPLMCWKGMTVLHKILREGHPNVCSFNLYVFMCFFFVFNLTLCYDMYVKLYLSESGQENFQSSKLFLEFSCATKILNVEKQWKWAIPFFIHTVGWTNFSRGYWSKNFQGVLNENEKISRGL